MASTSYKINNKGVAKFLRSEQLARPVMQLADGGRAYAESISPRGKDKTSGEFAGNWKVSKNYVVVKNTSRVAAKLENTTDYAVAVEYGWKGRAKEEPQRGHRVLGKTKEHMRQAK